tara:strand:- start:1536 stop:1718 length:183 start_codon:yes stop_codon:yes gene_type:complete
MSHEENTKYYINLLLLNRMTMNDKLDEEIERLRKKELEAVEIEDYERAAELRDKITQLKQ